MFGRNREIKATLRELISRVTVLEVNRVTNETKISQEADFCIICKKMDFIVNMATFTRGALMRIDVDKSKRDTINDNLALTCTDRIASAPEYSHTGPNLRAHTECMGVERSDCGNGWNVVKKKAKKEKEGRK